MDEDNEVCSSEVDAEAIFDIGFSLGGLHHGGGCDRAQERSADHGGRHRD